MYAIVEIAGKQFRVKNQDKIQVPLLNTNPGNKIQFDKVLFYKDKDGNMKYGSPLVESVFVTATILEHGRSIKTIVFKKKRRKGYQKKNGHRQGYSLIEINEIGPGKTKEKEAKIPKAVKKVTKKSVSTEKATVLKSGTIKTKQTPKGKTNKKKSSPPKSASKVEGKE